MSNMPLPYTQAIEFDDSTYFFVTVGQCLQETTTPINLLTKLFLRYHLIVFQIKTAGLKPQTQPQSHTEVSNKGS